jgi:prefoldin subunit 5
MLMQLQIFAAVLGSVSALVGLVKAYNAYQRQQFALERRIAHFEKCQENFSNHLAELDQTIDDLTAINLECRHAVSVLLGKAPTFPPKL